MQECIYICVCVGAGQSKLIRGVRTITITATFTAGLRGDDKQTARYMNSFSKQHT